MISLETLFIIILLGSWIFARVFSLLKLPPVLGITIYGLLITLIIGDEINPVFWDLVPSLKTIALIIILLRAGLGISRKTLVRIGGPALRMAVIPFAFEATAVCLSAHWIFSWPLLESALFASIIAAVSPAVVVPSMLKLMEHGYGKDKEVPTLVLAGASLDDVIAISVFTLLLNIVKVGGQELITSVLNFPLAIVGGLIPGVLLGFLLVLLFRKFYHSIRATEKTLLVLGLSLALFQLGEWLAVAALLGIMGMGFVLLERFPKVAHELASKLQKAWIFAEIFLFVTIGMSVDLEIAWQAGALGLVVIVIGLLFRSLGVILSLLGSELNRKERLFCVFAYLPKATVQAALGAIPVSLGIMGGAQMLSIAVLAILVTAPLGLIAINISGTKFLNLEMENDIFADENKT